MLSIATFYSNFVSVRPYVYNISAIIHMFARPTISSLSAFRSSEYFFIDERTDKATFKGFFAPKNA